VLTSYHHTCTHMRHQGQYGVTLNMEAFSLTKLMHEVVNILRPFARQTGINLSMQQCLGTVLKGSTQMYAEAQDLVQGDATIIQQVRDSFDSPQCWLPHTHQRQMAMGGYIYFVCRTLPLLCWQRCARPLRTSSLTTYVQTGSSHGALLMTGVACGIMRAVSMLLQTLNCSTNPLPCAHTDFAESCQQRHQVYISWACNSTGLR
jgi:hypothetical protein